MSFLNLRRLLPPKKVWKIFTNKLQIIKSHKLNRSRAIEKPKMQSYKTFKKLSWPFLSIQRKKFKLKPKLHTLIHLNKLTPPVYVDRLFVDSLSTVKQRMHPPPAAFKKQASNKRSCSSSYFKKRSSSYQKIYQHETRNEGADQKSNEADDMWESMDFKSPQTQGINERADEFIARFRAQMHFPDPRNQ
ncbi:hypothetical protein ACS0TY_007363 [Phlomoides rotata]